MAGSYFAYTLSSDTPAGQNKYRQTIMVNNTFHPGPFSDVEFAYTHLIAV